MARVGFVDYENASGEVKQAYDKLIQKNGLVTHMKQVLLNDLTSFEAYQSWYPLYEKLIAFTGELGAEVLCYAISTQNECLLCSVYFRKVFIEKGYTFEELDLSEKDKLLAAFGSAIAKDPNSLSDELFAALRKHFTSPQIVVLTAFSGQMIATNVFNSALQIELDDNLINYQKKD